MEIVVPEEFKALYVTSAEKPIVKVPHPVLRQKANEVQKVTNKVLKLADEMSRSMRDANGVGLAAPQLGVGLRVIVIAPEGERARTLINPVIVESEGEQIGEEGCLSIPGLYGDVKRAMYVEVEYTDRKGVRYREGFEEFAARVVQHEVDHLEGRLFVDIVDPATLHWVQPESRKRRGDAE